MAIENDKQKETMEEWMKSAAILIKQFKSYSDEEILTYSNIIQLPDRERETARMVLNMRLLDMQKDILREIKSSINSFSKWSTGLAIAMIVLASAQVIVAILKR